MVIALEVTGLLGVQGTEDVKMQSITSSFTGT
jgi:hypothetical protein